MENIEKNRDNLTDAPIAATKTAVKQWLIERGAKGIISTNAVASILGVSRRVVKNAENENQFTILDKCTYTLDSVAEWLLKHPRYIAQDIKGFEVTEELYPKVKQILLATSPTLVRLWNGDVDDLTHEVCFQIAKNSKTSQCSENTIIRRAINNIWHRKSTQQMTQTSSIENLGGNQQ